MVLTFDCRLMFNSCPTASNCSQNTGDCQECTSGWQHSNLFIVANDCMQPTWFPIAMIAITCIIVLPSLFLTATMFLSVRHHHIPETYVVGGWVHVMWSKQTLVLLNMAFQFSALGIGIACSQLNRPFVGMLWCLTGVIGLAIIYGVKQRLISPALVMHRDAGRRRRHIERKDVVLFIVGIILLMVSLVLCGVGAFLDLQILYNVGILQFLVVSEIFLLISLLEMMWMARQVKKLGKSLRGKSNSKTAVASTDKHRSQRIQVPITQVGERYTREANSKEQIDDLDHDLVDDDCIHGPISTTSMVISVSQMSSKELRESTDSESRPQHAIASAHSSPLPVPRSGGVIHVSMDELRKNSKENLRSMASDRTPTALYLGDREVGRLDHSMARIKSIGKAAKVLFVCFQPLIVATMAFIGFGTLPFAWVFASCDIWICSMVMTLLTYRVVGTDYATTMIMSGSRQNSRVG